MKYFLLLVAVLFLPLEAHARSPFGQAPAGQSQDSGLPDDPAKLQEMIRKLQEEAGKPKIQVPTESPQGRLVGVVNGRKIYEGDLRNPEQFKPVTAAPNPDNNSTPKPAAPAAPKVKPEAQAKPSKEVIRISDLDPAAKAEKAAPRKKAAEVHPSSEPKTPEPKAEKKKAVKAEAKPAPETAKTPEKTDQTPPKKELDFDEAKARQEELHRRQAKKDQGTPKKQETAEQDKKAVPVTSQQQKKDAPSPEMAYFRAGKKAKVLGTASFRGECEGRFWGKSGGMIQVKPSQPVKIYGYTMDRQECGGGLGYDVGQGFMCGECFDVLSMTTKLPRFEERK